MIPGQPSFLGCMNIHLVCYAASGKVKEATVRLFGTHCFNSLFTLKFHLLDHKCNDLEKPRGLGAVNAFPFDYCNVFVTFVYKMRTLPRKTRKMGIVSLIGPAEKEKQEIMIERSSVEGQMHDRDEPLACSTFGHASDVRGFRSRRLSC